MSVYCLFLAASSNTELLSPALTATSAEVEKGAAVTITCAIADATVEPTIEFQLNDVAVVSVTDVVTVTPVAWSKIFDRSYFYLKICIILTYLY